MKVGIDTFGCDHGRSGIGSYLSSLTANFKNTQDTQFELFGAEIDRYTYARDNNLSFESIILPDTAYSEKIWHRFACNAFALRQNYDVMLFPASSYALPSNFKVPSVAVVNDIVSEMFKHKTFIEKFWMKQSLKKVDKIIAASTFIKKDLKRLGIKSDKIVVVHNGINHSLFYQRDMIESDYVEISPFAIRRPYFIYASTMSSPLKRHKELIEAFNLFKEKTSLPHRLVLAGNDGEYSEEVKQAVIASKYSTDIFLTGYFPHESFPVLYAGAEACIFPSEMEGVGLPILEAMATGIPVACSKNGALQEVAGDKAILFDSTDINEIEGAMEKIACDKNFRRKMIEEGLEWTKRFSWEKTAAETIQILKSLVK